MPRTKSILKQRLEAWHLKRNPFPTVAIIQPYSDDPIQNGSVFAAELRKDEIANYRHIALAEGYAHDIRPWSWIWARKTMGKNIGTGKTAMLTYIHDQINRDYGHHFFGRAAHWLAIYVAVSPKTRSLDELMALILTSICEGTHGYRVDQLLLQRLRQWAVKMKKVAAAEAAFTASEVRFTNTAWMESVGIDQALLAREITAHLIQHSITPTVAQAFAHGKLLDHLVSLNGSPNLFPPSTHLKNAATQIVMYDIARIAQLAGIANMTIMLDNLYFFLMNIAPSQREQLARELRTLIVDGPFFATRQKLFNWTAIIHTQTSHSFANAWNAANLDKVVTVNFHLDPQLIALQPLSYVYGRTMLETYLKYQRPHKAPSPIHPFTPEALDAIVRIASQKANEPDNETCTPRTILQCAHDVMHAALFSEPAPKIIDVAFVEHVLNQTPLPEEMTREESDEDVPSAEEQHPMPMACACPCHQDVEEDVRDLFALLGPTTTGDATRRISGYTCHGCGTTYDTIPQPVAS